MSKRRRTDSDRQYDRERHRKRGNKRHHRVCVVCESEFVGYHASLTCSATCRETRAKKVRELQPSRRRNWPSCRVTWRTCGVCERAYPTGGKGSGKRYYCSEPCSTQAARHASLQRSRRHTGYKPRIPACRHCGTATDEHGSNCDQCRKAVRSERRRREKTRRRKRLVVQERYTLAEIAERDRCRCGLCGRKVPMQSAVPHPQAPTIDHILPLAVGGDDTRANVQLAHFRCNWQKRDGGEQQLRLVG